MAHAEASARTVEAAVTAAAAQLGLRPDQVDVEVLEEPVSSTFGYIGTPARVRVTPSAQATPPSSPGTAGSMAMGEGRAAASQAHGEATRVALGRPTGATQAAAPSGGEDLNDTNRTNDSYGWAVPAAATGQSSPGQPLQAAEARGGQEPPGGPSESDDQQSSAPGASDTGMAGVHRATAALGAENGPSSSAVTGRVEGQAPAAGSRVGGGNHGAAGPEAATGLSASAVSAAEALPASSATSAPSSATGPRRASRDEPIEPEMVEADTERAGDFLEGLLDALDVDGDITTWIDESGGHIDLEGSDLDVLVGSNGETLDALQELTRIAVLRRSKRRVRLLLDINGYRARHRDRLTAVVKAAAERVIASREDHEFEPMTPAERKIIHDAVAAIDGVRTESLGEEPYRRVVIRPA